MELKGKKVAVLGLGVDGQSILKGLTKLGALPEGFTWESSEPFQKIQDKFAKMKIPLHGGGGNRGALTSFDAIVQTPGSKIYEEEIESVKDKGIPVLSDLDLVVPFLNGGVIGVTGTNGKTTTVSMIETMLKKQGYRVLVVGGDFDRWDPLFSGSRFDYYLFELSSRRLENSKHFHANIAVLLNIFPAHEERHPGGLPAYIAAKAKIFANQGKEDFLVHEGGAPNIRELLRRDKPESKRVMFALESQVSPPGIHKMKNQLLWEFPGKPEEKYSLAKVKSNAPTFILNLMAAIAVARLCKVEPKKIQEAIHEIEPLHSRLQRVRTIGNVKYYDDSRATNIGATVWALSSFSHPLIWIAGGIVLDKENLKRLMSTIKGRVKSLIVVGSDKAKYAEVFGKTIPTFLVEDLKEAVRQASQLAEKRDVVIFSPAAPPDPFTQGPGLDRGKIFQKLVMALKDTPKEFVTKPSFTRI